MTPHIVHLPSQPALPCPCGTARRAFTDLPAAPASIHLTQIDGAADLHLHRTHAETYYVLTCGPEAGLELDGERYPGRVGDAILILPGVRHRAFGPMTILNFVVPPFDPADEEILAE